MTATVERTRYKFRLKEGAHVYNGPDGQPRQAIGGDTVETVDDDLAARFGRNRWELIDRQTVREPFAQATPGVAEAALEGFQSNTVVDDGLDAMTVPQLRKLAKDEDIDLTEANGKDEIVTMIRMARDVA
jgi:hypothetical protein